MPTASVTSSEMKLVKVLRIRPSETEVMNRLSVITFDDTGAALNGNSVGPTERQDLFVPQVAFKGGYEDVRLEVYEQSFTLGEQIIQDVFSVNESWYEFELKFIKLFKTRSPGSSPPPDIVKKYSNYKNQYGDTKEEALEYIIEDFIVRNAFAKLMDNKFNMSESEKKSKTYYKIIQNPWQDEPPLERNYGVDPYFLTNKTRIQISWHLPFTNGTVSFFEQEYAVGLTGGFNYSNNDGSESYNKFITVLDLPSCPVAGDLEPGFYQKEADIKFAKDEKKTLIKSLSAFSEDANGKKYAYVLSSNDIKPFESTTPPVEGQVFGPNDELFKYNEPDTFPGDVKDLEIINKFIDIWKKKVPNYDLKLCVPNFYPSDANLVFKDPGTQSLTTPNPDNQSPTQNTADDVKFNLSVVYDENIRIRAGEDFPNIEIYVGDPPKKEGEFLFEEDEFDELYLLDDEYVETEFRGNEEAPITLVDPPLKTPPQPLSSMSQETVNVNNNIQTNSGPVPAIPKAPSHTASQGYNILDSKWIGDLNASAKAHVGHQTSDIPWTGKESCGFQCNLGALACASAVSIMFYRAYGVHMRDGKVVKDKPTEISDFGTRGTDEMCPWLLNEKLYKKRDSWRDAQPGDIVNTARAGKGKAGHVGIVIDEKNSDGSWTIVSNSSTGFNDGGSTVRAIKKNYSVKAWEDVAKRNPSKTYAVQYIGPKR